ncbi:MAG: type II/IV secretion system protein [Armatimonadota bacterium]|nr:MAG: type II/IV secretion system protein [Armatimonadota bacterium]
MTLQEQGASEAILRAEDTALAELSHKIVLAAAADNASDIHIDPARGETKVRFRIDGAMHDVLSLPRNVHDPLVTRFKSLADLDTANRRSIQTGRIVIAHEGREYDLRETVLPTVQGEKLTLRIWAEDVARVTLDQVGFSKPDRDRLNRCLCAPCGLIVFSGPTGCGKTTIMHAAIMSRAAPHLVAMSVEDPVEIRLPGVVQISVNRKLGMHYAEVLRGILRSDPDIVMVGEMPDVEAVQQTVETAITGHLVLTTLHADDAASALERLLNSGADPFLLSQASLMVSSQRLVRRIHADCKQPTDYSAQMVAEWRERAQAGGIRWPDKAPTFHRGKGCDRCHGTGYSGRTGVFEILVMEPELRDLVSARAERSDIHEAALRHGMTTMFADGMAKALSGETTAEEVVRVLGG